MPPIDPNVTLLLIAVFQAITAFLAWRTHSAAKDTQTDVAIIEKATNSMKDRLVEATGKASRAEGKEEGLAIGEVKAAELAKGQLSTTQQGK